ncbi:DUF4263 domain-containing protein [Bradyrhizobium sp. 157]|uniref:Shedu anti-phage system protein SduA domain-containing protein n=1 Tax=Bradyrhizobium sp. 157 TaxID=2782631 RepID=UPI001FFC27E9|nr:Shedu anti-phage system protein SduA domain-containing protein [Bradyrhizobium sp. 157]MCK1636500.1 DUF4263 domain-containing protein [Bradyrhizobium sp. 157]
MTHDGWADAVENLKRRTRPASEAQKKLAAFAGIRLPTQLPRLVAAARLVAALGDAVGAAESEPIHPVQKQILAGLAKRGFKVDSKPNDRTEANAWISHLRLLVRQASLEKLRLQAGDIVEVNNSAGCFAAEVSSIAETGRVYFKGGNGASAWPDQLKLKCRRDDHSAKALKARAAADNFAAHRARTDTWSESKQRELAEFEVNQSLSLAEIEQLQEVIDDAKDEKAIQDFIESCPQVLTSLLGGKSRFLLSRRSLGGKYIPDFLICDTDSAGVRWLLVELETPHSAITLNSRNDLDDVARKGVSQIKEWREWLQNNLGMARRSPREDGLGLVDIRPKSEGLVLVGRRARLKHNSGFVRNAVREDSAIRIHTYDWLVEQLLGNLQFNGPPALSPYVIPPPREKNWLFGDAV